MILPDDATPADDPPVVAWNYLRPHYERGALFFVDPELAFEAVNKAFTENDSATVATWLNSGDLVKISDLHASQWEQQTGLMFEALIISPFVLCRPAP